jgi:hypothetical protein
MGGRMWAASDGPGKARRFSSASCAECAALPAPRPRDFVGSSRARRQAPAGRRRQRDQPQILSLQTAKWGMVPVTTESG